MRGGTGGKEEEHGECKGSEEEVRRRGAGSEQAVNKQ